jgi:hypothetical protein
MTAEGMSELRRIGPERIVPCIRPSTLVSTKACLHSIRHRQVPEIAGSRKTIIKQLVGETSMNTQDKTRRAYVLVEIQPGKEKEFANEIMSKKLLVNPEVERVDFVHGPYDFVITLSGAVKDIDRRIIEIRKSQFIVKTETLI